MEFTYVYDEKGKYGVMPWLEQHKGDFVFVSSSIHRVQAVAQAVEKHFKRFPIVRSDDLNLDISEILRILFCEFGYELEADTKKAAPSKKIARQLGIKHRGRPRVLKNRADYEEMLYPIKAKLLGRKVPVSLETAAEELGCDERTIRNWNKEFDLDWKTFASTRKSLKRKNLG